MIARFVAAAGLAALLPAAAASAAEGPRRVPAHEYDTARCTRQAVHTPAGKMVHTPPIVHCYATVAEAQIARGEAPSQPNTLRTARD